MPKLKVNCTSKFDQNETFAKVKNLFETDKELQKLDPGYKCEFNDSNHTGSANGKFFKAKMTVNSSGGGAEVEVNIDLPMTLALAKGMIQKTLSKKLEQTLS